MPTACVIFDFDGVIADTERLHLAAYNAAYAAHAQRIGGPLVITPEAYFLKYIVYSDREGFWHMLRDAGLDHSMATIDLLCETKMALFHQRLHEFAEPLPGVRKVLAFLEDKQVPRAICSGARKAEIVELLHAFGLHHHFDTIVAIDDVRRGKPDPEGYNKAFEWMFNEYDGNLLREHSLVIEDSSGGMAAGKAAGIPVLGVATSLPLERVQGHADHAVQDLEHLDLNTLAAWLRI